MKELCTEIRLRFAQILPNLAEVESEAGVELIPSRVMRDPGSPVGALQAGERAAGAVIGEQKGEGSVPKCSHI
jgi:hypothetical protein